MDSRAWPFCVPQVMKRGKRFFATPPTRWPRVRLDILSARMKQGGAPSNRYAFLAGIAEIVRRQELTRHSSRAMQAIRMAVAGAAGRPANDHPVKQRLNLQIA